MKFSQVLIALAVSISGTAFAADDHGHEAKPMHGGVTAQAKDVDYELVAKADKLQLFMRDHGKPFDVSGMTAKATLLAGSDKQEVQHTGTVELTDRIHRARANAAPKTD